MFKRISIVLLSLLILAAVAAPASAAIRIKRISFNPSGADSGTNRHLNREWILIKNTGSAAKQLQGWRITDRGPDHRYRFASLSVAGGDVVKLHTGRGSHRVSTGCGGDCTVHHYYWGLDNYVWNNDGDRATLKRPSGTVVDRCAYSASASSPTRC